MQSSANPNTNKSVSPTVDDVVGETSHIGPFEQDSTVNVDDGLSTPVRDVLIALSTSCSVTSAVKLEDLYLRKLNRCTYAR